MGVFERPKGSKIYWILYYAKGKRHREKVGRHSDALALYNKRKAEAIAGEKMPELRRRKVLLAELIDDAVEFSETHNVRSHRDRGEIVKAALGSKEAASLTPQDLSRWLGKKAKTGATFNRYKAFLSLCFREGMANGKVLTNPARMVRGKREAGGRLRFLSRAEAGRLEGVIAAKFPQHLAAFRFALHTGMRLSEQYTLTWKQVGEGTVRLSKTKNGTGRTIPLNSVAAEALRSQRAVVPEAEQLVFPRQTRKNFDTRSWFHPAMAEAGIEGFVWHGLRHTFCSWLAMAGCSLKTIQELAGHKTISMSARYSHLSPDHKQSEVERIAAAPKVVEMKRKRA